MIKSERGDMMKYVLYELVVCVVVVVVILGVNVLFRKK